MAFRNIIKNDDNFLKKKSRDVTDFDKKLHTLLDDLKDTLKSQNGAGLAAPQVGILKRAAVVDIGDGAIEIVNPKIISQKGKQTGAEGCLSYPGIYGIVTRPMKVKVLAFDRYGKQFEVKGEGLLARALCHEIEHLDGVVFKDVAEKILKEGEKE